MIDKGKQELYHSLGLKNKNTDTKQKVEIYILLVNVISAVLAILIGICFSNITQSILFGVIQAVLVFIPITEIVIKIIENILGKIVKPKYIPKMDLSKGITKENRTMVVIPTIVDSRRKSKRTCRNTRSILSSK